MPRPIGVSEHHAIAGELGIPGGVLGYEELRKDFVVGEGNDVRDAPQLSELARGLETSGLLLLDAHPLAHCKGIERGTEWTSQAPGIEHNQRSVVPGARVPAVVIPLSASDGDERYADGSAHSPMMHEGEEPQKAATDGVDKRGQTYNH